MVKKLLTIVMGMMLTLSVMAQVTVNESEVAFWTGTGSNSTIVAIGWDDDDASYTPTVVVWGVRWNGTITLLNALDTIAAYDNHFSYTIGASGFLSGLSYVNPDEGISLTPSMGWNCNSYGGGYGSTNLVNGTWLRISESTCDNYNFTTVNNIFYPTDPASSNPDDELIAREDILFWVGNGTDSATVIINWVDEFDNSTTYAWGLAFDDEEGVVVSEVFDSISAYDPRFYHSFSRYMGSIFNMSMVRYVDDNDSLYTITAGMDDYNCVKLDGYDIEGSDFEDEWISPNSIIEVSTDCLFNYDTIIPVPVPTDTPVTLEDALIDFSDILYWVGSGSDSAALIVNFGIPDTAFAWGFLFNGSATVQQMTDSITAADPRFTVVGQPSLYPDGDIFFVLDNGDTLSLSGRNAENPWNYWEANINGGVSYTGAGQTLTNGDVFKYGDQRAPTRVCLEEMSYGGTTYCLHAAWTKTPTPVSVPDTAAPVDTTVVPVEATIAAEDILYWVGEGSNEVVLAVNWADTALAWGYRFDGTKTVSDMMTDIAAADPRFSFEMGTYGLDDILFAVVDGDTLRKTAYSYWESKNNGTMDAGMAQPLVDGDFEKWAEPAAGVVVDSTYWADYYYWSYTYVYPMAIHPVSVPDTAAPVDTTVVPVEATIAAEDILYWVGEGSNEVVLAVNWADTALAWGYRFSGTKTVNDMMTDIAAADPRFSFEMGTYGLDDILFAVADGDTLRKTAYSYWESKNNGTMDAGMAQPLVDGDFEKWAEPAAGVVVDSTYWAEYYYWSYSYVYPMTIYPVSVPDTTTTPGPGPGPQPGSFCGAVGTEGCNAIAQDSTCIVAWATAVELTRGPQMISNPDSPLASFGGDTNAIGPATPGNTMDAVSLGDGGSALVTFAHPIRNGEGPDFAVYENSFGDSFLELAFVEVSSDGERFVRFPATSLTQTETQTGGMGSTDPTNINNLAGKFRIGWGTPFDLEELRDSTGIDIDSIVYVRIVDVVGSINPQYATYDAYGNMVNDPWPTNFNSSGFDLTGVAVMYERIDSIPVVPGPADATIAASDILYWVGTGSNEVVMAVNWADTALAWGYRFNGSKTVSDMMTDIAAADPRFSFEMGDYGLDDILFVVAPGDTLRKQAGSWWESKNNGISDAGMAQPLVNGDFEKWAEPAAGVVVDSVYYEGWGWNYIYAYTMEIHPVSVPTTTGIDDAVATIEGIWPNPTTDIVNVSVNRVSKAVLYDISGRQMAAYNLAEGNNTLDLSHFTSGIYMLRVDASVFRIIKK